MNHNIWITALIAQLERSGKDFDSPSNSCGTRSASKESEKVHNNTKKKRTRNTEKRRKRRCTKKFGKNLETFPSAQKTENFP